MPAPWRSEDDDSANEDHLIDAIGEAVHLLRGEQSAAVRRRPSSVDVDDDVNSADVVNVDAAGADDADEADPPIVAGEGPEESLHIEVPGDVATMKDIAQIFRMWEVTHVRHGFDPEPILKRYVMSVCGEHVRACSNVFAGLRVCLVLTWLFFCLFCT